MFIEFMGMRIMILKNRVLNWIRFCYKLDIPKVKEINREKPNELILSDLMLNEF